LSDREILWDIVSYCPSIVGVKNGMTAKKISKTVGMYIGYIGGYI